MSLSVLRDLSVSRLSVTLLRRLHLPMIYLPTLLTVIVIFPLQFVPDKQSSMLRKIGNLLKRMVSLPRYVVP